MKTRHFLMIRTLFLFLLGGASTLYLRADPEPSLRSLEGLVEQWADLRLEISEEQRAWDEQKAQLNREIDLLEKEKGLLGEQIATASHVQESDASRRTEDIRRKEQLTEILDAIAPLINRAEAMLKAWPDRLPPPLRESLEPTFRKLGDDRGSAALRLQRVVSLYTEIEKLQNGIHVVKELLTLPDGSRREVDVCYIGLAQGYAVSSDGEWAAIGKPGPEGWGWETRPNEAGAIREAISVYRRELPARLVVLPFVVEEDGK